MLGNNPGTRHWYGFARDPLVVAHASRRAKLALDAHSNVATAPTAAAPRPLYCPQLMVKRSRVRTHPPLAWSHHVVANLNRQRPMVRRATAHKRTARMLPPYRPTGITVGTIVQTPPLRHPLDSSAARPLCAHRPGPTEKAPDHHRRTCAMNAVDTPITQRRSAGLCRSGAAFFAASQQAQHEASSVLRPPTLTSNAQQPPPPGTRPQSPPKTLTFASAEPAKIRAPGQTASEYNPKTLPQSLTFD